jgi:hypothetical protein
MHLSRLRNQHNFCRSLWLESPRNRVQLMRYRMAATADGAVDGEP